MATIESRCGLLCSAFNCKEQFGFDCKGCAQEKTIPWGTCAVKVCCEEKKLDHCGLCGEFPCTQLHDFSFDKEHGDNGARIEQCRQWKTGGCSCPGHAMSL